MISPSLRASSLDINPPAQCRATLAMVYQLTDELAARDSRERHEIRRSDYERAKLELTGESNLDKQMEILKSNDLL